MISSGEFYSSHAGPLQQGDILLAGVARLTALDRFTPPKWEGLDEYNVELDSGGAGPEIRTLYVAAGPALVMVTSHDCHFDKEWNRRRNELIRSGKSAEEANAIAEADDRLDRTFLASPLIDPQDISVDRGNLMAGKIMGYMPVPASMDGLVPDSVVDLAYRVTLDRLDVRRVASVTQSVRSHLRYGLAQLDSLRATQLGFEIEAVVGKHISRIELPERDPLLVRLHFDDGTSVDLLQHPADPPGGPARQAPPTSAA